MSGEQVYDQVHEYADRQGVKPTLNVDPRTGIWKVSVLVEDKPEASGIATGLSPLIAYTKLCKKLGLDQAAA